MPGPGRFGGGGGGFRGGGGGGGFRGGGGGGGFRGGPGWGRGPILRPHGGIGPLGVIGAVATGMAVSAVVAGPRRHRYPPPRPGYIYVVSTTGQAPRAVSAQESSFIVMRTNVASQQQGTDGEVLFQVQVTMNDGYTYAVAKRYSQFDQLRERVTPALLTRTPPFPPKRGMRNAVLGLGQADLEERRSMLHSWLQSLCTAASVNNPSLRLPLYDFLETVAYYPPEASVASNDTSSSTFTPPTAHASGGAGVAFAPAIPFAETVSDSVTSVAYPPQPPPSAKPDTARGGDGWGVPVESREASDLKLAMKGPDEYGRLAAGKAAEALREGTGAGSDDLRAVWELSDIDKDGMLDRDEFAVAWYLAHQAAAGNKPPSTLPPDIVPPSKRPAAPRSSANPF